MKLEHHFTVPAPVDTVWSALDDLPTLVPCVPGASLTSVDGDTFEGTVKVKLGPISMVYGGKGVFLERDQDAGRVVVEAKGKDKRGNGTAGATVTAQLTADGESTTVDLLTDLAVTGKPAQFGRGVIQDVSDKLLGQFVDRFTRQLEAGGVAEDGAASDAAAGSDADAAGGGSADGAAAPTTPVTPTVTPEASPIPTRAKPYVPPESDEAELDLLSSVMPVLLKRAITPVLVVTALIVGFVIGRGRRR